MEEIKKKEISYLLGAGFSVEANYPTANELNERLRKINMDEILIDSSGISYFLKPGEKDVNAHMSHKKRSFVQKLLEYYCQNEISSVDTFDYERFFDWATDRINNVKHEGFDGFIADLQSDVKSQYKVSGSQLVDDFLRTYNQLIYQMLYRRIERIHYSTYPNYQTFLRLLSKLGNSHIVHIHTLNHDLFMEQLWHTDHLAGKHSDGFDELGSKFYAENHEGYRIRLEYYTGVYTGTFRLYKLHGSVNYIPFNFNNAEMTMVKSAYGARFDSLLKEYKNDKGEIKYFSCWWNYHPDFLTGVKTKPKRYDEPFFYEKVFKHFEENLSNSGIVIVIGYAFRDDKVNKYLMGFLSNSDNLMIVIDPVNRIPPSLDLANLKYIKAKSSEIPYDEIKALIGNNWLEDPDKSSSANDDELKRAMDSFIAEQND